MKIILGADHRGIDAIRSLGERLKLEGHSVHVLEPCTGQACDYPEPAFKVGHQVSDGSQDAGILICGTGVGMSIAANKVHGVRAAVAHDELTAQLSKSHNNANVLCLSADLLGQRLIEKIVDVWLKTPFEGGRHARRVRKIAAIEQGLDPATIKE
ncbi:MAG: ribose 5-phosphate isomerase B [Phycisphaerales bacterium]